MLDSTDDTAGMSNSYTQPDEHEYALNDAPIARLIGWNDSPMGESTPQIQTRWCVYPHHPMAGAARWKCQAETRPTVMSEKHEITSTECFEAALKGYG